MEKLVIIEKKINELVKKTQELARENERLVSQEKFMKDENSKAKKTLFEIEQFSQERKIIRKKITDLLEKYREAQI